MTWAAHRFPTGQRWRVERARSQLLHLWTPKHLNDRAHDAEERPSSREAQVSDRATETSVGTPRTPHTPDTRLSTKDTLASTMQFGRKASVSANCERRRVRLGTPSLCGGSLCVVEVQFQVVLGTPPIQQEPIYT